MPKLLGSPKEFRRIIKWFDRPKQANAKSLLKVKGLKWQQTQRTIEQSEV